MRNTCDARSCEYFSPSRFEFLRVCKGVCSLSVLESILLLSVELYTVLLICKAQWLILLYDRNRLRLTWLRNRKHRFYLTQTRRPLNLAKTQNRQYDHSLERSSVQRTYARKNFQLSIKLCELKMCWWIHLSVYFNMSVS